MSSIREAMEDNGDHSLDSSIVDLCCHRSDLSQMVCNASITLNTYKSRYSENALFITQTGVSGAPFRRRQFRIITNALTPLTSYFLTITKTILS